MLAGKETCVGFDVGKSAHRACAVSRSSGKVLFDVPVDNRADPIDGIPARAGAEALVIVDQKRNIGTLVLERARAAGMDVAYLPGLSMKRARDMFPGVAKTDEIDAEVIARTAVGTPWALRPVADEGDAGAEIRLLASQRRFLAKCSTQSKNRLRSVLLEADPAFEAAIDLGLAWQVGVLAELGGSRHKAVREPRQAGVVHRARPLQQAVGLLPRLGVVVEGREQGAKEPAHLLVQLARRHERRVRPLLRCMPRARHASQQGPQGRGQKEAEGHLRRHERRPPSRSSLNAGNAVSEKLRRRSLVAHAQKPLIKFEKPVDKTIETPL